MRSGNYINQGDYKTFKPAGLGFSPPLDLDSEMILLLSEADQSIGRLDMTGNLLPDVDLFVTMYVRKEAVVSSQIEGTQATLLDLLEFEAAVGPNESIGESSGRSNVWRNQVTEIYNHVNAMNVGLAELNNPSGLPLSLRLIRRVHKELMDDVRGSNRAPGNFRNGQNYIGGTSLSNAIYVPPTVPDMREALADYENYMIKEKNTPELIKAALLHYQFETIHPFWDGNGRVGRLMITMQLCDAGLLHRPLLYPSYYFKRNRREYYDLLQAVRDTGDYESWVKFFLKGIVETSAEAVDTAKAIVQLREKDRLTVQNSSKRTKTALEALEQLYRFPVVNATQMQRLSRLSSKQAAYALIAQFESLGILKEHSGRLRNREYRHEEYLNLLSH